MGSKVIMIGNGSLSKIVFSRISKEYDIETIDLKDLKDQEANLVLLVQDEWEPSLYSEVQSKLQSSRIPWLNAFLSDDEGIIGPLVRINRPGCPQCADSRRLLARRDQRSSDWPLNWLASGNEQRNWCEHVAGLRQMALLLLEETSRVLRGGHAITEDQVFLVDLKRLNASLHPLLPDPSCDICGSLPDDSPETAIIHLQPRMKYNEDSYRCRSSNELEEVLHRDYLDNRLGLMNRKTKQLNTPFADVCVHLPIAFRDEEVTAGRSHSYAGSERIAILEGLERYCGFLPRGKRMVVNDCYRNVEDQALNPVMVGLYSKEQYAQPEFDFQPFDPDLPMDWTWGYSFLQERPILVPSSLVYYNMGFGQDLVSETSNGCALGSSLEEAILFGMLEVVERDSFLLTWYARLPVPRIDPYSADNNELQLMIERIRAVCGYDVMLYNTTTENGIPSIWAIAKNRNHTGVNLLCGAGAHLDPVRAAINAIHEISGILPELNDMFRTDRKRCMQMLYDSSLVRLMEDHALLYGLPEAQERMQFLLNANKPLQTFHEGFKSRKKRNDLTDDLKDVLQIFKQLNLDVIVVNHSSPETLKNGLHCVKVLIPGMLPMTFGHHLTRITGLERILRVPVELGYYDHSLPSGQINPYPHPFP